MILVSSACIHIYLYFSSSLTVGQSAEVRFLGAICIALHDICSFDLKKVCRNTFVSVTVLRLDGIETRTTACCILSFLP